MRFEEQMQADPYGSCVSGFKRLLSAAFELTGKMSEEEYNNLKEMEEHVRRLDNS